MTMLIEIKTVILAAGLAAAVYMLSILLWSAINPEKRIWPPRQATTGIKLRVWFMTTAIFACAFLLGILDWNRFDWPVSIRWTVGLPLILIGNLIVWRGVHKIGMAATSGEATGLVTDGLYRKSRNPQYVADMLILIGWEVLSASIWTLPVIAIGIAVLAIAPFAEEPWLEEEYGDQFRQYKRRVRRFI